MTCHSTHFGTLAGAPAGSSSVVSNVASPPASSGWSAGISFVATTTSSEVRVSWLSPSESRVRS